MRPSPRHLQYWLHRRRRLLQLYEDLPRQTKEEIDRLVEDRLVPLSDLFRLEIRPENGLAKVILRERHRLLLDELCFWYSPARPEPHPYQENSDGCHPGMVFIPGGDALLGVDRGFSSREEQRRLAHVSGFWIDVVPVTNGQYQELYPSHVADTHSADPEMPVVAVSWFDAHKFAVAIGKRLPTQEEWEKAARGPESWAYSFGNEFDSSRVHIWPAPSAREVRSYEPNPCGLYQMSGNIWEWIAEVYCHEVAAGRRVYYSLARGGSWRHCRWGARATQSLCLDLAQRSDNVGFRCACSGNGFRTSDEPRLEYAT